MENEIVTQVVTNVVSEPLIASWVWQMFIIMILGSMCFTVLIIIAKLLRIVVLTNEVHIVQSTKKTISYGKDQVAGNTYYKWPSWVPKIGVQVIILPVSVFNVELSNYSAYDKGRVPFAIDIMAFFRIGDSNVAAERVKSFEELRTQLKGILQGAIRSILASSEIEEILEGRSKYGREFTVAVDEQLKMWGVSNVKNVELMDIRDTEDSRVILNIMAKKKSLIERQSRVEVAENLRVAQEAEIIADREVSLRKQEAEQQVGQRTAEKEKQVGIAGQQALQAIKEESRVTAEKDMAINQVNRVRTAEIERETQIVLAEQEKQKLVIKTEGEKQQLVIHAEGQKQQTITVAEGNWEQAQLLAKGIQVEGVAKGEAEKAILLAPVVAQITLAEKISAIPTYQTYLVNIRTIEKEEAVGKAQAEAIKAANIKVIANSGNVVDGVSNAMNILNSSGGTQIGAMLEAIAQTDIGKKVIDKLT